MHPEPAGWAPGDGREGRGDAEGLGGSRGEAGSEALPSPEGTEANHRHQYCIRSAIPTS